MDIRESFGHEGPWHIRMACLFGTFLIGPALAGKAGQALNVPGLPGACLFKIVTGHDCPACGITRSVSALYDLDIATSLQIHPAGPAVAVLTVSLFLYFSVAAVSRGRYAVSLGKENMLVGLSGVILTALLIPFWVFKLSLKNGGMTWLEYLVQNVVF